MPGVACVRTVDSWPRGTECFSTAVQVPWRGDLFLATGEWVAACGGLSVAGS